ncbi:MAG: hypothetical protein KKB90_13755 [Actinobacteria bacterium]|nr:hypothetical protein [Actinomycetota bacterium]
MRLSQRIAIASKTRFNVFNVLLCFVTSVILLLIIDFVLVGIRPTHAFILRNAPLLSDWRFFLSLWVICVLSLALIIYAREKKSNNAEEVQSFSRKWLLVVYCLIVLWLYGLFYTNVGFLNAIYGVLIYVFLCFIVRKIKNKKKKGFERPPLTSRRLRWIVGLFMLALPFMILGLSSASLTLNKSFYIPLISQTSINFQPDRIDVRLYEESAWGMLPERYELNKRLLEDCAYLTSNIELKEKSQRIAQALGLFLEGTECERKGDIEMAARKFYEAVNARGVDLLFSTYTNTSSVHMKDVIQDIWQSQDSRMNIEDKMIASKEVARAIIGAPSSSGSRYIKAYDEIRSGNIEAAKVSLAEAIETNDIWYKFAEFDPYLLKLINES